MSMHQATRVRFRGGDPLALTKRIEARREANVELDRVFGGEEGISPIRFRARPVHHYADELRPAREPIEPIVTSWKEAWSILWQAGLLLVLFVGIAWTGPIFGAVVLR